MAGRRPNATANGTGCAGGDHPRPVHIFNYLLGRGERSIAAVSGAPGVGGHSPEMISGVRTQARDVGSDILVITASLGLIGRSGSIADGSPILKVARGA